MCSFARYAFRKKYALRTCGRIHTNTHADQSQHHLNVSTGIRHLFVDFVKLNCLHLCLTHFFADSSVLRAACVARVVTHQKMYDEICCFYVCSFICSLFVSISTLTRFAVAAVVVRICDVLVELLQSKIIQFK